MAIDASHPGFLEPGSGLVEEARFELVLWRRSGLLAGNRNGQQPLGPTPWAVWWWLAPLLFVMVAGSAFFWSVNHIETAIEARAGSVLTEAGLEPDGLTFVANYRDLEIRGRVADNASTEQIVTALEGASSPSFDIRSAAFIANDPSLPLLEFARIDVDVMATTEAITVSGAVPSHEHEAAIMTAATASGIDAVNNLTVSGLAPSSNDPDRQIDALTSVLLALIPDSFTSAAISVADEGPVVGQIAATSREAANVFAAADDVDVDVSAPPVLGSLDIFATFDGERIVLDGTVLNTRQQNRLVTSASEIVGFSNVVNNLNISHLREASPGSDDRIDALAAVLRTFDGLVSGDAALNDTDFTVNAVAFDEASQAATRNALAAGQGAGLRPGGVTSLSDTLPVSEQIDLLQGELDALRDQIAATVIFEFNSVELSPEATATLDQVADALTHYPLPVVEIGGHTDARGPEVFNEFLSQQRADAVAAYLGERIGPDRVVPIGFGESNPIADNGTREGRRQNRRVEFIAQESF